MSSDPLPLPEIWSDLPKGGAAEAVRSEPVAGGRIGLVLSDYAGGYVPGDSQPIVRSRERGEQAVATSGHPPGSASATLAKGLSDLAAIVMQAEALLRAQGTLKGDVHFAVERIHDVALALRMRDVNSALCDMLESSVREVGDAVVRHEAAATGALSAAALLGDILHRIEQLMRIVTAGAEPRAEEGRSATDVASVIGMPAPLAPAPSGFVATPASFVFETKIFETKIFETKIFETKITEDLVPAFVPDLEQPLELRAPAAENHAYAAIDPTPAAAEVLAHSVGERSTQVAARPLAHRTPAMADPPLAEAFANPAADDVFSRETVPRGATAEVDPGTVTSEEVAFGNVNPVGAFSVSRVFEQTTFDAVTSTLAVSDSIVADAEARQEPDAFADPLVRADETLREPPAPADTHEAISTELSAARVSHLRNDMSAPAEIVAGEGISPETRSADDVAADTAAAETAAAETVAAETVAEAVSGNEMVDAEAGASGSVSSPTFLTQSVAPDGIAAVPAEDQGHSMAAPPTVEVTPATIPVVASQRDPDQPLPSEFAGKASNVAEAAIRRPASDPLAAFYGLSEEELIALFS